MVVHPNQFRRSARLNPATRSDNVRGMFNHINGMKASHVSALQVQLPPTDRLLVAWQRSTFGLLRPQRNCNLNVISTKRMSQDILSNAASDHMSLCRDRAGTSGLVLFLRLVP